MITVYVLVKHLIAEIAFTYVEYNVLFYIVIYREFMVTPEIYISSVLCIIYITCIYIGLNKVILERKSFYKLS